MRRPRALSAEEAALWARVAATVAPMAGRIPPRNGEGDHAKHGGGAQAAGPDLSAKRSLRVPLHQPMAGSPPRTGEESRPLDRHGLDAGWDRRLAKGLIAPDFTLDLHGHSLDAAWARLEHGLALATTQQARVVLVITGRSRPAPTTDRAGSRGAIRAKIIDWLAAGSHAGKIAAVRTAHPRHGGVGALYVVLKRPR